MAKSKPRVIIAGGGISGLSLANMLEKVGVDFVLLESYDEIAPQVGASIGLQSNGLRILDQLGCADELLSLVDFPLSDSYLRNSDGSIMRHHTNINILQTER
jgi:2-polyprenyl-6-methoxyphenol hydroxylase-like FAD-dependent oxidoreductase